MHQLHTNQCITYITSPTPLLPLEFKWKTLHAWKYAADLCPQNWNTRHLTSQSKLWSQILYDLTNALFVEYGLGNKIDRMATYLATTSLSLFIAPEIRFCPGLHLPLIRNFPPDANSPAQKKTAERFQVKI